MADSANHHGQQSCHVNRTNPHILLEAMSEGLRREGHMSRRLHRELRAAKSRTHV